jgi:hypothetical protein
MAATAFNRICAHPMAICWIVGALVLDVVLLVCPVNGGRVTMIATDWQGVAYLLLALVATTGLGFCAGVFACWPWMRPLCSRFNGAPLKVGDRVEILTGPHRGTTTSVYEVTAARMSQLRVLRNSRVCSPIHESIRMTKNGVGRISKVLVRHLFMASAVNGAQVECRRRILLFFSAVFRSLSPRVLRASVMTVSPGRDTCGAESAFCVAATSGRWFKTDRGGIFP